MYKLAPEGLNMPLYGFKSWIIGTSVKVKQVFLSGKGVASLTFFILCVILYTRKTEIHSHIMYTLSEQNSPKPADDKLLPNVDGRLLSKLLFVGKEPVISENCKKEFPNAIIIGVMKGGTEAFSTFLGIHPQVAMQFEMRSTLFFTTNFNKGYDWYKEQMPCRERGQVTVDKSPQYWPSKATPSLIHKFNPNIKLILIVRNPIDRSVSHFLQQHNSNPQKLTGKTFEQNVLTKSGHLDTSSSFIELSAYSVILKNWLKYFKLGQILIIDGDNFKENPAKELSRAEHFLGITPYISPDNFEEDSARNVSCIKLSDGEQSCLPMGKGRTHPQLNPGMQKKLVKYFKPYNEQFFKMTGMNFDWSA